jgi:succinate-semialdehyde dehydrogenase/glutarate-semialdehyde dehydrogenase
VAREETFGPVVSVQRVASDEEAVAAMNDTEYGLNASIWTGNTGRGRALAARVEAGSVNVNEGYTATFASMAAPMGGMKASGLGRRHGRESIEALTEVQTIAVQRGASFGLTMDRLYELGGEASSKVLSGALEAMRRWGMP